MKKWQKVLSELVQRPLLHAKFLNTISLMEYMGARKIVKSQLEHNVDSEVLSHMTEEIRHAQIFKKMALKLSEGKLKTYADEYLLAGAEGRAYIQSVDQSIAAALNGQNAKLNYMLSTLLIEERANEVYPFYAELLQPSGFAGHLRGILREEEHHLEQIKQGLENSQKISSQSLEALRMIEEQAFNGLIDAVERSLSDSNWEYADEVSYQH